MASKLPFSMAEHFSFHLMRLKNQSRLSIRQRITMVIAIVTHNLTKCYGEIINFKNEMIISWKPELNALT